MSFRVTSLNRIPSPQGIVLQKNCCYFDPGPQSRGTGLLSFWPWPTEQRDWVVVVILTPAHRAEGLGCCHFDPGPQSRGTGLLLLFWPWPTEQRDWVVILTMAHRAEGLGCYCYFDPGPQNRGTGLLLLFWPWPTEQTDWVVVILTQAHRVQGLGCCCYFDPGPQSRGTRLLLLFWPWPTEQRDWVVILTMAHGTGTGLLFWPWPTEQRDWVVAVILTLAHGAEGLEEYNPCMQGPVINSGWLTSFYSYLHSCEPPIIHGNLACDTIFIQHNGLIKIGSGKQSAAAWVAFVLVAFFCRSCAHVGLFPACASQFSCC